MSDPVSEIKTRSPMLTRGDHASSPGTELGCQQDAGMSVPAGRPHPHPDATSPAAVGRELRWREAGAPHGNAKHRPGCRAEKPPTPCPAPAPAGLRATRGDQSNPMRDFSGTAHSFLPREGADAAAGQCGWLG